MDYDDDDDLQEGVELPHEALYADQYNRKRNQLEDVYPDINEVTTYSQRCKFFTFLYIFTKKNVYNFVI